MTNIFSHFDTYPLVTEGESKIVRYIGDGEVAIVLKPTIYSFTHNRNGSVEGSDTLRLKAAQALLPILQSSGINHTYRSVNNEGIISKLVMQPVVSNSSPPFRPDDLCRDEVESLPRATPLEVVVKARHTGTPKHRYHRMSDYPCLQGQIIAQEEPYPTAFVRFDWRNPMYDDRNNRLADEVLPETMALWYINVSDAKNTALTAFNALSDHFASKGLDLWDICFFIAEDGKTMFGEVSPDCMRVRAKDGSSLDKDIWRSGGTSEGILTKWQQLVDILEA